MRCKLKSLIALVVTNRDFSRTDRDFVFIVGSGRSGNTILRRVLMERARVYFPPESYVIPATVRTFLQGQALDWPDKVDLFLAKFEYYPEFETYDIATLRDFAIHAKSWPESEQNIGDLLGGLYFWIADEHGFSVNAVGDKTPLNTLSLGLLGKIFPKAKYIYIERDGVDVAVSYVRTGIYQNLEDAANRWKNSKHAWKNFRKTLELSSYKEVSYEELVRSPDRVTDELINFLQIDRRESRADVVSLLGDVTTRRHHENVTEQISSESIGAGRRNATTADLVLLKTLINSDLIDSGYDSIF